MSLLIDLTKSVRNKSIEKVSNAVHQKRVSICDTCPNKLMTGNCASCGCFVKDKAKYADEQCPEGKW